LDGFASWFPVGKKLIFHSGKKGEYQIFTIDPDGSNREQITSGTYNNMHGNVSPDGNRIVFDSERSGNREIYVMECKRSKCRTTDL